MVIIVTLSKIIALKRNGVYRRTKVELGLFLLLFARIPLIIPCSVDSAEFPYTVLKTH